MELNYYCSAWYFHLAFELSVITFSIIMMSVAMLSSDKLTVVVPHLLLDYTGGVS
jgi:hypothetical protein